MVPEQAVKTLEERFGGKLESDFRGMVRVSVPRKLLFEALKALKEEHGFDMLIDVTCVDYLHYPEKKPARFGLVYNLLNTQTNERIVVRCWLDLSQLEVPSVVPLWEAANWLEREVFDMFGVKFVGHPDLRRILLPEQFTAHPLRKDYPLQGRGERHNFPRLTRAEG